MVVDIIVIIVLLISAGIAFLRGFIREVLTILGVLGGLVAAYNFGGFAAKYMRMWLDVQEGVEPERLFGVVPYSIVADVLGYGLVFIVVVIALSILSHMLAEGAKNLGLGAVDRSMGVVFGIARGAVLLGLLYLPVYMLAPQDTKDEWFEGSKTYFYLEKTAAYIHGFLPESTVEKIKEDGQKIQETNATREKLKDVNLLGRDDEKDSSRHEPEGEGYDETFREKMDELFDKKSGNTLNE